jgi:O-antigen ligase
MPKMVEGSLIFGIVLAVLSFGGAEPISFAIVQLIFLIAVALLIVRGMAPADSFSWRAFAVPAFLTVVVLLQLCPFPASWVSRFSNNEISAADVPWSSWSIEPHATRNQLLILVTCLIAFYFAQLVSQTRKPKGRLVLFLLGLGTFESFYGLVQYLSGWQRIFAYAKKYDLEDATGTYINRNHYAGLLEMILPFGVALILYEYGKLRGNDPQSAASLKAMVQRRSFLKFVLCLCISVVLFVALIFSRSRMGILAASASILIMFGFAVISRRQGKASLVFFAVFAVLSLGLAIWIGPGPIVSRFENVGQEYSSLDQSRLSIWRDAVKLIERHPVFGTGLGTFPVAFTSVQTAFLGQFVNHAHNDYLELASDVGVPAALMLFATFVFILARATRVFLRAAGNFDRAIALGCVGSIVAILLHSLTDFNLYMPANALVFSAVLGLAISSRRQSLEQRSEAQ